MIKKMMSYSISFCIIGILLSVPDVFAAEVQIKRFKAGDVIYAEDVNADFQVLADTIKQLQTLVAELQKQNKAVNEENQALKTNIATLQTKITTLEKQVATVSKTAQPPTTQISASKTPKYRLRNTPKNIESETEARKLAGLDRLSNEPCQYIENDFADRGDVVIDYATGLMWQKAGSDGIPYEEAKNYMQELYRKKFAGYADWRLPTIEELSSLVEEKQVEKLYLNPVFNFTQLWCWSSDTFSSERVGTVSFTNRGVYWNLSAISILSAPCGRGNNFNGEYYE